MLAWRFVTRLAITIRRLGGSQLQKRCIHPSRSHLQALPQPNTWFAKIRSSFRLGADGKPRSKLMAFGFGFLILSNLSFKLFHSLIDQRNKLSLLEKMAYFQQVDFAYDSVDFDDPISTLSYFKKFYLSFTRNTKGAEQSFDAFMVRISESQKTKEGSKKSSEVEVHDIMRSAAKEIHDAFRELNQNSIANTCNIVMSAMFEALKSLLELDDGDSFPFVILDLIKKDAGVSKDYESLGNRKD